AGPVTLGFRAEDVAMAAPDAAEIAAPIYSVELLGDATLVTIRSGAALVAAKASKTFRAEIGDPVGFRLAAHHCHLFDCTTGLRIGTPAAGPA
ncbi:MAG: TOBE domain-containing protein, partial [Alsobacter sp.]